MSRTVAYGLLLCGTVWAAPSTPSAVGPFGSSGTEVNAAAAQDLHECQTRSTRPFAEIVAAFADDETPNLPAKAVTIHAGEQLCIVGTPTAQGQLVDLRVVPSATAGNWMSFQLEIRDGRTTLRVQHGGRRPMRYTAARVATELDLALPTSTMPVRPGVMNHEFWPVPIRRFVLFAFAFFEPEVPASRKQLPWTRSFPGEEGKMPIIGLTLSLGEAHAELIELERVLVAEGYSTRVWTTLGSSGLQIHDVRDIGPRQSRPEWCESVTSLECT